MPTLPPGISLNPFADTQALVQGAVETIAAILPGAGAVALTGGRTARSIYALLAADPALALRCQEVNWFWGDERFVPLDHADSNCGMAMATLLDPWHASRTFPVPTQAGNAETAARDYEAMLRAFYGSSSLRDGDPLFDLVLLGLGPDGHIASLFPDDPALQEKEHWAVAASGRDHPRVTLTLPALESARAVIVFVAGAEKADALSRWLTGDPALPVTWLKPACGIQIFADEGALASFRAQ